MKMLTAKLVFLAKLRGKTLSQKESPQKFGSRNSQNCHPRAFGTEPSPSFASAN
jgi:hypothetical protein